MRKSAFRWGQVLAFCLLSALFSISCIACSSSQGELQGVTVSDSGAVAVTFRLPDGKELEDVLGSEVGVENTAYVSNAEQPSQGKFVYWYAVGSGGIVSRYEDVYRYSPTAELSSATGVSSPPAYAMLYFEPKESDILKWEDSEELAKRYGIVLRF